MKLLKRISAIVVLLAIIMTLCASALASTVYYTTGKVNMRKDAKLSAKVIRDIPKGAKLTATNSKKDSRGVKWVYCSYGGKKGWVSTANLKKNGEKHYSRVVATDGDTYIRKSNDRDSKKLGILPQGKSATYLQISKKDADGRSYKWYKVTYKGITGYVSSRYTSLRK